MISIEKKNSKMLWFTPTPPAAYWCLFQLKVSRVQEKKKGFHMINLTYQVRDHTFLIWV